MSKIAGNNSAPSYVKSFDISGFTTGVMVAWENSNNSGVGAEIFITRAWLDVTTVASGTCTIDFGVGDAADDTADARSDDMLDGINGETLGIHDSIALDIAGATAACTPLKLPVGDFALLHVKTGSALAMVGKFYIEYTYV